MSLSIGLVGLPNVGKSTLFNALTSAGVLAANYPFATIEPNVGVVAVPDDRLAKLSEISESLKSVPAIVNVVDIAGLVRGAADGAGLGNKFLAHIRSCDAIVVVVRAFSDSNVVHVDESVDPARDIETISTELCLADLASLSKRRENLSKEAKAKPANSALISKIDKLIEILNSGKLLSVASNEIPVEVADLNLLTTKQFIYAFNLDETDLSNESKKAELSDLAENTNSIFLSAQLEADLAELSEAEKLELLAEYGQSESGLSALARVGYDTLGLASYYTSGVKESRAWTIKKGSTAPEAASVIHTDFERGFIKADVVSYDDFVDQNGWLGARNAGKVRLEGRDYIMADDDVVEFKFNV